MSKSRYSELYQILNHDYVASKRNLKNRIRSCGSAGVFKHAVPSEVGGYGDSFINLCQAHEDLGFYTRDSGLILAVNAHIWSCIFPLIRYGTSAQKNEYLASLISGELIGAHAITEPNCGSDISAMETVALGTEGGFILNGHKKYITNSPIADLIIIYARDGEGFTAFIVKPIDEGVESLSLNTDGFPTSEIGEIRLLNCFIPQSRVLGKIQMGLSIFQQAIELERAFIFSGIVGIMKFHFNLITSYANHRKSKDKPLTGYQAINHKIAEMGLMIETVRLWINKSAKMLDDKERINLVSSYTKLYSGEAVLKYYLNAVQIMGASALHEPYHLSQFVLDGLSSRLLSGSSEIQKNIISALVGGGGKFLPMDKS